MHFKLQYAKCTSTVHVSSPVSIVCCSNLYVSTVRPPCCVLQLQPVWRHMTSCNGVRCNTRANCECKWCFIPSLIHCCKWVSGSFLVAWCCLMLTFMGNIILRQFGSVYCSAMRLSLRLLRGDWCHMSCQGVQSRPSFFGRRGRKEDVVGQVMKRGLRYT